MRQSRRALNFLENCDLSGFKQFVSDPTRETNTLDLILCNHDCVTDTCVTDGLFVSDHKQVSCALRNVKSSAHLTTRQSAFNYKRADFDALRTSLSLVPWSMLDNLSVDGAVERFYDILTAAIRDCIPVVLIKRNFPPWFDHDLRNMLREKEFAFRRVKRNRCEATESDFRDKRRAFRNAANSKFSSYLIGLTDDFKSNPKRFWSFLKGVNSGNRSLSALKIDGREITDDRDKGNVLNRVFASKFSDITPTVLPDAPVYNLPVLGEIECDYAVVLAILDSIPVNKACGPDGISARIIRECSKELAVPLVKICQMSLRRGVFPERWKEANVVPVFKKGNVKDPHCYRSISLIPLFGKVLEKLVYVSLLNHVEPAISPAQHGFTSGRSCVTNLASLLGTAWDSIENRFQTDCIYTDFSAAFQSVNHTLLIHKLQNSYNITGSALRWFSSYLDNRKQRVVVNGKCSEWCRVTSGTPEGGLISPILFSMFINDLPDGISSRVLMFADDAKLFRQIACDNDAVALQNDLDHFYKWSKTWMLNLNPTKCKAFRMTLKTKPLTTTYSIGNTSLENVDSIRDLGVILDSKLTFSHHIDQTVKKANRALGVLIRSFQRANPRGYVKAASVLTSYFAYVRSNMEYCCVIWGGAARTHTDRLDRIEHKFLMWLNAHCRSRSHSLAYADLLSHFKLTSVSARRTHHDLMFIRSVFRGIISSSFLLQSFSINVPSRATRRLPHTLLTVPFARVNTVKEGLYVRLPKQVNGFMRMCPGADLFADTRYSFRNKVKLYVSSL